MNTVKLYRWLNPWSRAKDHTTWYGSTGVVRRATCIYCRQVVATSSAKYPETAKSYAARVAHGMSCAKKWFRKQPKALVGLYELATQG